VLLGAVLFVVAAGTAQATATPEQVVRAWSHALNTNDNAAAARLFAMNARVVQPGVDVRLSSHAIAVGFNNALPCAGTIIGLHVTGSHVLATFLLGHRPKHRCDGPGQKAAALFVIRSGKIVLWKQVPVPQLPTA
jgi:limonene-1,2-epoxide hydrolase